MAYKRTYYRRWYPRRSVHFTPTSSFSSAQIVAGAVLLLLFVFLINNYGLNPQTAVLFIFLLFGLSLAVIVVIGIWLMYRRSLRWRALEVSQIDHLRGIEFENYLAGLLMFKGFNKVIVTPPSGDYGADLTGSKDGEKWAFQAKQYNHWKKVGVDAIGQVKMGENVYNCQRTMVITTGYFTRQAHYAAKKANVVLIDRDTLLDWISEYIRK